jgi:hypothetical protein
MSAKKSLQRKAGMFRKTAHRFFCAAGRREEAVKACEKPLAD